MIHLWGETTCAEPRMTDLTQKQFVADSLPHWQQFIQYSQLQNSGWEFARRQAAVTPAGTTLDGFHAHILARKATWDALWEEYLGLHHAQERVIEGFSKKVVQGMKWVSRQHYDEERGVAVFLGAGNFSQGGWKAGAVREGFRKVVQQPSRPIMDDRPDRLVILDEFCTSRVSSSVHARQPCELHLPPDRPRPAVWVPPAGQVNQRLVRPACSLRHAKYVRGLQWCHEYQQGFELVNDRLPKGRQRLHRAAEFRRGIDGRARNNVVYTGC
ncbi:hypothetical protein QJQ45_012282 [Haematococcus lacustris]|nr:hypothetical protein QJQ45_012282 [Haematococcus lacustris]